MISNSKPKAAVFRAWNLTIPKIYALVYSLVAIPMVYYGVLYIAMVSNHIPSALAFFGLIMISSVVLALIVQRRTCKQNYAFLTGTLSGQVETSHLKKNAVYYPLRLSAVMIFGWIVLVNVGAFLPLALLYSPKTVDLVICNLLILSSGLMSLPMTYFIAEKSANSFLELPEVLPLPEPQNTFRFSLTAKILIVCLIIILTIILNITASILLSVSYELSQLETILNLAIISVQGIIATIVISRLFASSLKASIAHIHHATHIVKTGDLNISLPHLSNDELGDTSDAFNTFISKLSASISEIKQSVEQTGQNVADLQAAMINTDASVNEINKLSETVKKSVIDQAAVISEVAATIEQIDQTIAHQDQRINDQSASVVESSAAIEQMIANIQSIAKNLENSSREFERLQQAIKSGDSAVDGLKTNVELLSQQSDSVIAANTIIKNIASQTNLLAMNAAIEAAHAGDAGRGFAVVADEIRKLAEVSNQQSKLISDSVKQLKNTIEQAVTITGQTGSSFEVIISAVQRVNDIEREIQFAMDEQSTGSSQILEALTGINDITSEVHVGSTQMKEGSKAIIHEINGLVSRTEQVKDMSIDVAEKAHQVKKNTDEATKILTLNAKNMSTVDELVAFFK